MVRAAWMFTLAAASLILFGARPVLAQPIVVYYPPSVSYSYAPPPVSYYAPPVVYAPAPRVSYYYAPPAVSYYAPPAVSYYSAPAAVTTTHYGFFGYPRARTTYYYPPSVYVGP